MTLDGDGHPVIAYQDQLWSTLRLARWDGVDWQLETVDEEGDPGYFTSVATDSAPKLKLRL